MANTDAVNDNTPIMIGVGQVVEREAGDTSPMQLAIQASQRALADTGSNAQDIAAHIDTVCVTKLFSDMGRLWDCKWGRSNNPPQSIAAGIGATPRDRIYTETGGNQPQSRLIEFAADIASGKRSLVLYAGSEALKNQRHAERSNRVLDWNEEFSEPLEDRGFGEMVATDQEMKNGLNNVAYYYGLIEQAQRHSAGRSIEEHRRHSANLLSSFSKVAAANPYAQFVGEQSADDILAAPNLSHVYTKRMIAQDSVNQAAAMLLCTVGLARTLGVPESKWVYLHGMAEGTELKISEREDPASAPIAGGVAHKALEMAKLQVSDIGSIDIYSCFPCAVVAIAQELGLPTDGSRALTTTGGLPYFGGPGNNYSMHAVAEAVQWARANPSGNAMVTANGGVLSKHASAIYSQRVSTIDWSAQETTVSNDADIRRSICANPGQGKIVSYVIFPNRAGQQRAIILGETESGERFVAATAEDDQQTAQAMLDDEPTSKLVALTEPIDEKLTFQFVE